MPSTSGEQDVVWGKIPDMENTRTLTAQAAWDYSALVHLFIELRGRGMSLSAADLEVVQSWKRLAIPPDIIAEVFHDAAHECTRRGTVFPSNLAPLARRVQQVLKQQHEF